MSDVVGPPTYAVTKLVRGLGGRWNAQRPSYFTDNSAALAYARDLADKQRHENVKGVRIVVTQGATLIREYKV